jgi:hypothetical protein
MDGLCDRLSVARGHFGHVSNMVGRFRIEDDNSKQLLDSTVCEAAAILGRRTGHRPPHNDFDGPRIGTEEAAAAGDPVPRADLTPAESRAEHAGIGSVSR